MKNKAGGGGDVLHTDEVSWRKPCWRTCIPRLNSSHSTIFFPTQVPTIIHVLIPYLIMTNPETLPANRSTRQLSLSSPWRYKHDNKAAYRMDNVLFASHGLGQNHATWGRRFPIQQHLHICFPEDHKAYVNALHTCYDPRQFLCFKFLFLGSEITVARSVMEMVMKMNR